MASMVDNARDTSVDALRARRLQELQQQMQEQAIQQLANEEQTRQEAEHQANLDGQMRVVLTPEARSRLARIALVDPKRANSIKAHLAQQHAAGQLPSAVTDQQLKMLLASQSKSRSNASIRRI